MDEHRACCAKTCTNRIGPSDPRYPFPSGARGIAWQELLLGVVQRHTGSLIVCKSHFSELQYVRGRHGQMQLYRNALPDQNILLNRTECRFCLEPSKSKMCPLFSKHPDVPSLEDIEQTVHIRIHPDDGLPGMACVTCLSKIRYIKRIQDQFQQSDHKLRLRLSVTDNPDASDEDQTMEEEYLLEAPLKPSPEPENILLTADQLTIVEGAQEEIETSDATVKHELTIEPLERTEQSECVMLFSGDIQESTVEHNEEYDMTELTVTADSDDANGNDSPDEAEQKNGNPYKPFRYSKRARRGD